MRKYIYMALFATLLFACNEDKFLSEKPLDFMSGENSYLTVADFDASVVEFYYLVRFEFYCNQGTSLDYYSGTDMTRGSGKHSNLATELNPSSGSIKTHWDNLYKLIAQTNVVISRLPSSELTDAQKIKYEAKAKFFRGFAYRTLAYLFGGVPLQLEELSSPKTDYVRETKETVLLQAIDDVDFAAKNLDDITAVRDGEISSSAAYFLLSELYLSVNKNKEAAEAATEVIDHPALDLMRTRFGRKTDLAGDVYSDLFRRGNQNRSAGNTEGVWVIQFQEDITGGGSSTSSYFWDTPSNYLLERHAAPQVNHFRFVINGTQVEPFLWQYSDYTGGRGIGIYFPAPHFYTTVWESDYTNDIRNSNYNFVRKIKYNNPDFISKYGTLVGEEFDVMNPNLPTGVTFTTISDDYPDQLPNHSMFGYQAKCTTPYDHPDALYENKETGKLKGTAGGTYADQYMFRLSEAYLLRAEAYLKQNEKGKAADDINVVRRRANASDVSAADVDIDYILDERLREFGMEEKRRFTLSRTGEFYNRVKNLNPYYNSGYSADKKDFQETYTLYPIPQSVIEANKDAVLEQNPGYK
ncbi:RagB/SusD family nutrient uptake outer membrane protein [Bacteroides sp. 51]|uniref:RagB/SusD family nutrient uptake outer membrane protein n=1 Tax=Bacteroides sp. 51 TaxID=2302938 RepID=UPI0013D0BA71|nr:RagB/SusD family nutrient uptake outer membrane protein [Bacteroides sp. 51]NDV81611.1 RagB/SusD family nutrient uptake outer membrane protein [Bacteroides sp. 51]